MEMLLHVPVQPPWVELWRITTNLWVRLLGVDLEERRRLKAADAADLERQAVIQRACDDVAKKLALQTRLAGCDQKRRSERWNHARFMRWQKHHAAAFGLIYGKLTDGITLKQAEFFYKNFHYAEYLLAKRNHLRMREWSEQDREKLCELLRGNDRLFSGVRRFHKMSRTGHRQLMDQIEAAFSM